MSGHGDSDARIMTPAEWFRRHYPCNEVPDRLRICLYRNPFPCNAGCRFSHPRRCVNAERIRDEEAADQAGAA